MLIGMLLIKVAHVCFCAVCIHTMHKFMELKKKHAEKDRQLKKKKMLKSKCE